MIRFLFKFLIFVCIISLAMAGVNFYVDPANLFKDGLAEKQAASLLAQRHIITGFINCDARLLTKYYVHHNQSIKANHLVLGSSRAMLIDKSFADSSYLFYNSSVSGAELEDVMALYNIWDDSGARIKKVTLEVTPSWFNDAFNTSARWESISVDYNDFMAKLGLADNTRFAFSDLKYIKLLSPTYFQSSIGELRRNEKLTVGIADSSESNNIQYADGSIRYPLWYYNSDNITDQETSIWFKEKGFNFNQLSAQKRLWFNSFVTYMTNKNIEIELFVNVFHPQLYDMLTKNHKGLYLVEDFLRSIADSNNLVTFKGSYNPHVYGFSDSDFLDIVHPRKNVYQTILK